MIHDIIFYSSLLLSIALGGYYNQLDGYEMKKNYGTGLGLLLACVICGRHIYYTIILVWGNIVVMKCCEKSYVHLLSLIWTWVCLIYMHININNEIYMIWLHQNMALRLVGLAFEMRAVNKLPRNTSLSVSMSNGDTDPSIPEPTSMDIVSYAFFFIGLHKGPYYKWKTLNEHLQGSFGFLGNCRIITRQKLKKTLISLAGYALLRFKYSPKIYYQDSFYSDYDMDTRYISNIPFLLMYFLQSQILMLLSTSVCTEAGFGVYPAKCHPLPGHGPSTNHSLLKLARSPNEAIDEEFNFSMLKCFEDEKLIVGPRMTDTIRSWDMSTRYWFWSNTYKNLFKGNKELRGVCAFLAWMLWQGPSLQQIIISTTLWIYIHLETEYSQLYNTKGPMKVPWDIGFSIMRMFCLIYLTPCFIVKHAECVLRYYTSILWIYHIIMCVSIVGAFVIYKTRNYYLNN